MPRPFGLHDKFYPIASYCSKNLKEILFTQPYKGLDKHVYKQASKKTDFTVDFIWWV